MDESQAIQKFIMDLEHDGGVVIVEGKQDARALRYLGFTGTLMQFHQYRGFVQFADVMASHDHVVVLFDYDREGKNMTSRMVRLLQRRTKVDLSYRKRLIRITQGRIRFVEELIAYA